MKEILWLGRGGQGAFTAARLLGAAYTISDDDKYALAFPSFGPERRGAPVRAFTKLDSEPVADRSQTEKADYIVTISCFNVPNRDIFDGYKTVMFEALPDNWLDGGSVRYQLMERTDT